MRNRLFFDTETTGFPTTKHPAGSDKQPHLVQLGAILVDGVTRDILDTISMIIKPVDWVIPEVAVNIHGITTEEAIEVGVDEEEVIRYLMPMQRGAKRIAHNFLFDSRIVETSLARHAVDESTDWCRSGDDFCTMKAVRGMGQPAGLSAAYASIVGGTFDAHDALADSHACMEIYFKLLSDGRIKG